MRALFFPVLAGLAAGLAQPGAACAQGLQVSPVVIDMSAGQMSTVLTVTNRGASSVALQVRPFRWTQAGGTDALAPTEDLAVSPPMTQVAPGQAQTFRVVLRRPAAGAEASYRVLLDELPPPEASGTIRVALRISIPVFARPEAQAAPDLAWRIVSGPGGAALVAANRGHLHTRVLSPTLAGAPGLSLVGAGTPYVLANAERSWRIQGGEHLRSGTALRLSATTDAGPVSATVGVVAP